MVSCFAEGEEARQFMSRILLMIFGMGLPMAVLGCNGDDESGGIHAASCQIDPTTVDFGYVLTPPFPTFTTTVTKEIVITNVGTNEIVGEISIEITSGEVNRPQIHLSPEDSDPSFALAPGNSTVFTVVATVQSDTSPGLFEGSVEFGTPCGSVPLRVGVTPSQ
jgi:hypothetical protein